MLSRDRGWEGFRKTWLLSGSRKRMFQTGHKVAEGACVRHRGVSWGWVEVLLSQDRWGGDSLEVEGLVGRASTGQSEFGSCWLGQDSEGSSAGEGRLGGWRPARGAHREVLRLN